MNAVASDLVKRLGPGAVDVSPSALDLCARDSWPQALGWSGDEIAAARPLAVVRPQGEEQAAAALCWACERGVPVVPRGAGSGVLGAAIPVPEAVVLDASRLTSVFEPREGEEPALRVGAGMLGDEVERRLGAAGLALRHVPASLPISTVAGWIACRGYGQLSSLYGGIEEQLVSARALGPDGAPLELPAGAQVGAEGTLGFITEATIKVRRRPSSRAGWGAFFGSLEEGLACARDLRARGAAVLRLYGPVDAWASGLLGPDRGAGGGSHALETWLLRRQRLLCWLRPLAGRRWLLVAVWEDAPAAPAPRGASAEPAERWWRRRFQFDAEKLTGLFAAGVFADTLDVWAPYARLAGVAREVERALAGLCFSMAHVSHLDAAGACLYVTMSGSASSPEATRALHARAWKTALESAVAAGARATHHHGVGLGKKPWLESCVGAEWLEALSARRRRVDPSGLLNPGKLCR